MWRTLYRTAQDIDRVVRMEIAVWHCDPRLLNEVEMRIAHQLKPVLSRVHPRMNETGEWKAHTEDVRFCAYDIDDQSLGESGVYAWLAPMEEIMHLETGWEEKSWIAVRDCSNRKTFFDAIRMWLV
jgi:hypothetical protein